VRDLEAEAARRGMHNVNANRIVASNSEQDRHQAPLDTLTNRITSGKSDGWSLIYAEGPEGEQLEFVQLRGQAKRSSARRCKRAGSGDAQPGPTRADAACRNY
jgi:hypothetical protein